MKVNSIKFSQRIRKNGHFDNMATWWIEMSGGQILQQPSNKELRSSEVFLYIHDILGSGAAF